jgi:thiopeptide-type bacteriocin biosynthesis protein
MKRVQADLSIEPSGFFALRSPLLPLAAFTTWGEGLEAPAAWASGDAAALERALAKDRARLRPALREALGRADVREAIFVASPSLHERIARWLDDPESERGLDVERALTRYFARMAARPTPFGLFAGGSVGRLGDRTRLVLAPRAAWARHTRLDMGYLSSLTAALGASPALRRALRLRPNDSLYRAAGRLRYVEARVDPATRARSHHLVSVEPTDYLDATLARAAGGASFADLAAPLTGDDVTREEADAYVDALLDAQILVPELEPRVTGGDPLADLVATLREAGDGAAEALDRARTAIADIDAGGVGAAPARYLAVADELRALPAELNPARLFQVDLTKPAPEATLGPRVVAELAKAVALYRRIGVVRRSGASIARFREAFLARWEGREVPLLEALDEDAGVGFGATDEVAADPSPVLEGLAFAPAAEPALFQSLREKKREGVLLRLLEDARARGLREVALGEDELRAIENEAPLALPDAFAVMATLVAPSGEAADRGDFSIQLHGLSGPSGVTLLGRFCHADAALHAAVEAHLRAEEALAPDAIFAEIVHLPEGRMGNVICRPVLRAYEIPYLGRSGAPADRQIGAGDLLVSVRGHGDAARVVLRSRRLDRAIVPRLTCAHNHGYADAPVYRFLAALAVEDTPWARPWDWGPLVRAAFLPRVTAGRIVLAPARWRLDAREIERLRGARGAARFAAAQAIRAARGLPRFVALEDADNILPVDLDSALGVESFAHILEGREEASLLEGPESCCVEDDTGARYTHEIVVPFVRRGEPRPKPALPAPVPASFPRSFVPGSEWLFLELYGGVAAADEVLREVVRPAVDAALASGAADAWFFLRYADPDPHLRLRFHGAPARLLAEVLPDIEARSRPFREAEGGRQRIRRIALDTYEREVERYGGPEGVEIAEAIFRADSEAALAIVETLSGDGAAEARFRLALAGVDRLLDDLGLSLDDKLALARAVAAALSRELGLDAPSARKLDARYRRDRGRLADLLARRGEDADDLAPGLAALDARSEAIAPLVTRLRRLDARGAISVSMLDLAGSLAHMHCNRLFRSAARAQEMVVYDALRRLYESMVARRGTGGG